MIKINSEVLNQFAKENLTINEGIAVDARLVKSASRPISNDEIKRRREKSKTQEGKVDKNGKPLKFSRDLESDWVVQKDVVHYGLKEHASVDVDNGFILATTMTPASHHDSQYLSYCTIYSLHTEQNLQTVYADKGYFGKPNRDFLHLNNIKDGIMRKDTSKTTLTEWEKQRNKKLSKKRYIVEQYFGISHLHDRAKRARFTTVIKNIIDAMCRQAAFNITRGAKLLGFT
jgi:IS5 family transposase